MGCGRISCKRLAIPDPKLAPKDRLPRPKGFGNFALNVLYNEFISSDTRDTCTPSYHSEFTQTQFPVCQLSYRSSTHCSTITLANLRITKALEAIALAMLIISILFCPKRKENIFFNIVPLGQTAKIKHTDIPFRMPDSGLRC